MGSNKLDMVIHGTKKVGHGNKWDQQSLTWDFQISYYGMFEWDDMTRVPWCICGGIRFVFLFCPEELFVWQALGFQHFRLLGFHISDYWISTCPDSWKFRLPRFQFFGFPDFILWMFLYEMNSQEFLDNCLVFLLVLVSCSCEECKTCFFTYYRTQEHMYAHPGTFSKEAKAFILGI